MVTGSNPHEQPDGEQPPHRESVQLAPAKRPGSYNAIVFTIIGVSLLLMCVCGLYLVMVPLKPAPNPVEPQGQQQSVSVSGADEKQEIVGQWEAHEYLKNSPDTAATLIIFDFYDDGTCTAKYPNSEHPNKAFPGTWSRDGSELVYTLDFKTGTYEVKVQLKGDDTAEGEGAYDTVDMRKK